MNTSLSLVIPAYNEGDRLASGLQRLMSQVPREGTEIIVVNDGSSDDTAEIAKHQLASWPQASVLSLNQNSGKGAAVKAGVVKARGNSIAFMDADMATDLNDLNALLGALEHSHVAVGSRSHNASEVGHRGIHRTLMNRVFGMLVASMTHLPYTDTQCGFKAFDGPVAKLLFHGSSVDRFAFDVELMDLAERLGLRTAQVPVRWTDMPGSHVRPIHDGLQMLGDVAKMRLSKHYWSPLEGVLIRDLPIEAAAAMVQPRIRTVDLMVEWEQGTAVLHPCMPAALENQVSARLLSEFDAYGPEPLSMTMASFAAPMLVGGARSRDLEL